ncbi:hypothetical protein [Streptomyces peucetius]|uniref:DUF350 domain-containing protein n=1 Tax=Streptomyces peucetius TaxID=1950 RepID=A0ABY6I8P6_STRPE|nr:hypothetical protein [Streptomyces peucetius]UYQ63376.1 hypothetical protein OGH68_19170 [Streptomyces peucetius]
MTDFLIAVVCVAALILLLKSAVGFARAAGADPSAEARSVTSALYGCGVAVLALGLFITLT